MEYFESVVLRHDIPTAGLLAGDIGVLVEIHLGGKAYEIEFMTVEGDTVALLTLTDHDVAPAGDAQTDVRDFGGEQLPRVRERVPA